MIRVTDIRTATLGLRTVCSFGTKEQAVEMVNKYILEGLLLCNKRTGKRVLGITSKIGEDVQSPLVTVAYEGGTSGTMTFRRLLKNLKFHEDDPFDDEDHEYAQYMTRLGIRDF